MNEHLCPNDSLFLSTSKYEVTWEAQFCFAFFNVHTVMSQTWPLLSKPEVHRPHFMKS